MLRNYMYAKKWARLNMQGAYYSLETLEEYYETMNWEEIKDLKWKDMNIQG